MSSFKEKKKSDTWDVDQRTVFIIFFSLNFQGIDFILLFNGILGVKER